MKIINKREKVLTDFRNIVCGEVFLDEDCVEVFMALSEEATANNGYAVNAVNLDSGRVRWFEEFDQVYKVNAELTIT